MTIVRRARQIVPAACWGEAWPASSMSAHPIERARASSQDGVDHGRVWRASSSSAQKWSSTGTPPGLAATRAVASMPSNSLCGASISVRWRVTASPELLEEDDLLAGVSERKGLDRVKVVPFDTVDHVLNRALLPTRQRP
jgi:hypothetical protein